jgi:hypothetical protein
MSTVETTTSRPYCRDDELPVNPFRALRVSFGMLLGEEDFRDLMGNPRGKQMVHNSWLHGSGVVWGYQVRPDGARCLRVTPGLAIDGLGRELLLDTDHCVDLDRWLQERRAEGEPVDRSEGAGHSGQPQRPPGDCDERVLDTCLVAVFDTCQARPVPALADPCDLSRKHNECSRVVETIRLELRDQACPGPAPIPGPYHRLRVLLGLDKVGGDQDAAGRLAAELRQAVADEPVDRRVRALLRAFRELAALDVADLEPAKEDGDLCPSLFPITEDDAAVVLASVKVTTRGDEVLTVEPSLRPRRSLIATGTIQELACGLAPALVGAGSEPDAGGPRVVRQSVHWPDANRLTFKVTSPLLEGSLRDHPVVVTSLSERGWVREDIERIGYDDPTRTVTLVLHDPPAYDHVRVIVRGTGPTPVTGADYVPLAGLEGGSPGTAADGHDAVLHTTIDRRAAS